MEIQTSIDRLKVVDSKNSSCGYFVRMASGEFNWETTDYHSCYSSDFLREIADKLDELKKNFALG